MKKLSVSTWDKLTSDPKRKRRIKMWLRKELRNNLAKDRLKRAAHVLLMAAKAWCDEPWDKEQEKRALQGHDYGSKGEVYSADDLLGHLADVAGIEV